jgi:hypothetical protein
MRALELAEERGFSRVCYRVWFALLPLAEARGRDDLLRRAHPFFAASRASAPASLIGRAMIAAVWIRCVRVGIEPPFLPDVEETMPSFDLAHGGGSWLAAVETIVSAWLGAGMDDAVERALDRMRAKIDASPPDRLASAVEALLRGRLALERKDPGEAAAQARRSLELLGAGAPWWRAKAIRLLEAAGDADAELLGVAGELEAQLGIR